MNTNRWKSLVIVMVCGAMVVACGDADGNGDSDEPGANVESGDWYEQRSGLDLDPLQGATLPEGPDMDDVPEEFHPEINSALSSAEDARLLLYDGRYNSETYVYRAPIPPMEDFSDEAFETAMRILRQRNDRMGQETTSGGIANGWSDGEGGGHSEMHDWTVYDPTVELPEDLDAPAADQAEAIEEIITEALAADEGSSELARDEEGRILVEIEFPRSTWQYYVDVFDAEEVDNWDDAYMHGSERFKEELDDLFEEADANIMDVADCAPDERAEEQFAGVWACAEDTILGLADISVAITTLYMLFDSDAGESNSMTNDGVVNMDSGGNSGD